MPQEHTERSAGASGFAGSGRLLGRLQGFGPLLGLLLLGVIGAILNPDFATVDNIRHHLGRHRSLGGFDGGPDRRQHDPADERNRAAP